MLQGRTIQTPGPQCACPTTGLVARLDAYLQRSTTMQPYAQTRLLGPRGGGLHASHNSLQPSLTLIGDDLNNNSLTMTLFIVLRICRFALCVDFAADLLVSENESLTPVAVIRLLGPLVRYAGEIRA